MGRIVTSFALVRSQLLQITCPSSNSNYWKDVDVNGAVPGPHPLPLLNHCRPPESEDLKADGLVVLSQAWWELSGAKDGIWNALILALTTEQHGAWLPTPLPYSEAPSYLLSRSGDRAVQLLGPSTGSSDYPSHNLVIRGLHS
ncbi:hypothetical protein NDU88_008963 [Pleurodeles waltl]|uniref:Uncharacterized protein n=1 Tax=Pleurodeles waltl TaxID=8319 RepID=A0AAV7QRJ8_PLEWA|nr:hypothetical protein NDU88_008963 [Pleurodeles waltl]